MRVTLIHNAGAGESGQPGRDELERLVRAAGHEVRYRSTGDDGWEADLDRPADLIAVAGGDGTVGGVAKRIAGRGVPLTALPMGTANNIARTLGLGDVSVKRLIAGWSDGRRVRLDLGRASGPWGTTAFAEGAGSGLFAWTMPQADRSRTLENLEQAEDKIAYALELLKEKLRRCPSIRLEAELDGRDISGSYVLFEVMNMRYVGPNLYLAPDGDPGDGCLDVVTVAESERGRFFDYLSSWQKGHMREPRLPSFRGRRLRLRWGGFAMHFDDRIWPGENEAAGASDVVDIGLDGRAVEFLCPRIRTARESSA